MIVRVWTRAEFGQDWQPPACMGWKTPGFSTLVAATVRLRAETGADGILRRIGAVSRLAGLQYWSTTRHAWSTLISEASAVDGPDSPRSRADFQVGELVAGRTLYYRQSDNLSGGAIYKLSILEATPDRIAFAVENLTPLRFLFVTAFHPGEMQSVYFLDREPEGIWRCYGILRTGKNSSSLSNEASTVNRAVAFFRHLAGIPDTEEPPAAR